MKKNIYFIAFIVFVSGIIISQDRIREHVEVVNREVIVRVLHKGEPVDSLKKSDFKLLINGEKIDINGFFIKRQKLEVQNIELNANVEKKREPRFFVMAFSITEYNYHYKKGLDYLFNNILNKSDRLLVFINNSILSFNSSKNKKLVKNKILKVLKNEGLIAKQRLEKYFLILKVEKQYLKNTLTNPPRIPSGVSQSEYLQPYVLRFLKTYQITWAEYKRTFLTLNLKKIYNFSKFLKDIDLEKWVIIFYQFEKFPVINPNSEFYRELEGIGRTSGTRILRDVFKEQTAETIFSAKTVAKFFSNLDASFNLSLIPTIVQDEYSKEIVKRDISTSFENSFREIIKSTGGDIYFSSDLKKTFEKISKKEDIFYVISYAPEEWSKPGKLKVTVKNKKYKVLYDDNMRADYITDYLKKRALREKVINLGKLEFYGKELSFVLNNFKTIKRKGKEEADLKVKITIKNEDGKSLYEKEKVVRTSKNIAHLNIGFKWLKSGKYDLMVDVTDLLTGRSAFEYKKIEVK